MNRQSRIHRIMAALERLADPDILSLPEGRLALAVLGQAVADTLNRFPGGRLYLTADTMAPGSWHWWCQWLRIDEGVAREIVLRYCDAPH